MDTVTQEAIDRSKTYFPQEEDNNEERAGMVAGLMLMLICGIMGLIPVREKKWTGFL